MANKHLEGHGAPTIETVGYVGQQYTDLDTGDVYNCVGYTTHTIDDYKPTNPHEFVKFNTPTGKVRKYTWQLVPDNANNFGEVNKAIENLPQADWNQADVTAHDYIKNRPFYYARKLKPIEFTFDGNLEGKETVKVRQNHWAVKISDDVYPADTFLGGRLYEFVEGNVREIPEITEEHIGPVHSDAPVTTAYSIYGVFIVVLTDELSERIPFTKGTWAFCRKDNAGNVLFYGKSISGKVESGELKQLDEKYIPDSVKAKPDWNQNDETAPDYVKNRPFNIEGIEMVEVIPETTSNTSWNYPGFFTNINCSNLRYFPGETYEVTWKGVQYNVVATEGAGSDGKTYYYIGSSGIIGADSSAASSFQYPFCFEWGETSSPPEDSATLWASTSGYVTVSVNAPVYVVKKIDRMYLPDFHNFVGTGSFSMNRKAGSEAGANSFSIGTDTIASILGAYAEGYNTIASAPYQHVQGQFNIEKNSTYVHIVGNGRNDLNRSNAHVLDKYGNAWYAGDVYVGSTSGTDRDEGSKKLVANEDKEMILTSSTSGSTKKFRITVDDSGTITATEVTE